MDVRTSKPCDRRIAELQSGYTGENCMPNKSRPLRGMLTSSPACKLSLIPCVLLLLLCPSGGAQPTDGLLNPNTTLGCYKREYTFVAVKEEKFLGTYCWDEIAVDACWGRCDSNEKGDYKPPYKISNHPVCTYAEIKYRKVRLRYCHPAHPDPFYDVFDAVRCECSLCNSETTSCENLNG